MRAYGLVHPTVPAENPPDSVFTLLIANSSGQALDWPNTTNGVGGTGNNARSAGSDLVRFTGISTLGAAFGFMVNMMSTFANAPASGTSITTSTTAGSTGNAIPVFGSRLLQIPSDSTGYSVASISSGYVIAEIWGR